MQEQQATDMICLMKFSQFVKDRNRLEASFLFTLQRPERLESKEKSDQQCLRSDRKSVEPERFHQRSESAKSDRLDGALTALDLGRSKGIGDQTHVLRT